MQPEWSNGIVDIYRGDARDVLGSMEPESVHCVVTSPPYWGLRDYGIGEDALGLEPTPELYVQHVIEIFREVRRVLRNDGTLWLNLGDTYNANQGTGFDSNQDGGARKALTASPKLSSSLPTKNLVGIPWRVAFALQADGWYLRSDIIWSKPNPMPESVTDRPTKAHEYLFLLSKSERYYYDAEAIREPDVTGDMRHPYGSKGAWEIDGRPESQQHGGELRASRNSKKPDGWDTAAGAHGTIHRDGRSIGEASMIRTGRNKRTVWEIATQPYPDAHFATFPTKLVEPCVLAGCPEGGVVLDPFAGSGTVGEVAQALGRKAILVELNPEYIELSKKRIEAIPLPMKMG